MIDVVVPVRVSELKVQTFYPLYYYGIKALRTFLI